MRRMHVLIAGGFALLAAGPAAAQDFKPPANLFEQKKPAQKPPNIDWNWRPPADKNSTAKPTVVCGMTLVPADPKVDARMRVPAPDSGVTFTLRSVQPPICKTP
jgi:hypothetical protein